jgi:hypothetical protein
MRIEKDGRLIADLTDWEKFAPPKSKDQWVEGRSAYELARAWCGSGVVAMPAELRDLFQSRDETRGLEVEYVIPEHRIAFDHLGGEPRNADIAFIGNSPSGRVAVTIEAKADETFGGTVAATLSEALERSVENHRSQGVRRVEQLVKSLFSPRPKSMIKLAKLRYQLLTATAGTLAYALQNSAPYAVLIVHEFVTTRTIDERHAANAADYDAFLERLSGKTGSQLDQPELAGPFMIPGEPLFENIPQLFVGKIATDRRQCFNRL